MPYYSGTVSSFEELRDQIEAALILEGLTVADHIIHLNNGYYEFDLSTNNYYLSLQAGTTLSGTTVGNKTSYGVKFFNPPQDPITFPINYEFYFYPNDNEFIIIINHDNDLYQIIAFGVSSTTGVTGFGDATGNWLTGSFSTQLTSTTQTTVRTVRWGSAIAQIGSQPYNGAGLPFFCNYSSAGTYHTSYLYCDTEGTGPVWRSSSSTATDTGLSGMAHYSDVLGSMPSLSTQAAILLPAIATAYRPSGGKSIVASLKNVRMTRNDYIDVAATVTIGAVDWCVYPLMAKNTADRNVSTFHVYHSGTFAFALNKSNL